MKKFFKILKRIFIAILIIFIALMAFGAILTKCGKTDARDYTAAAATEEPEVEEDSTFAISREVYFNWDYNEKRYFKVKGNFSKSDPLIKISLLNFPLNGLPYTFELVLNSPLTQELTFFLTGDNGVPYDRFILLAGDVNGYVTSSDTFISGLAITSYDSFTDIDLDFTLYFYVGSYVPGYGQGLAAGIQQGYQDGYNQGAADTSAKYIAGIFGEATAQFGYTNQPVYSSIQFSDIQKDINDYVSFTGFPELTENYSYYVINIVFPEKIHYTSGLFRFVFNNKMPVQSNGFIPILQSLDASFIRITFNSGTDGSKNNIFSNSNLTIPVVYVEGTNYSYEISNTWLSQFSVDFQSITICTKLIPDASRYPNPYQTLQSLQFSNGYSDNANYYAGYDTGYNDGYDKGENTGYGNGIKDGYNNGYDVGLKEGEINGYNKAVGEGVSQEGIFYGAITFLRIFFQLTTQFLNTKIVGDITLGLIIIGLPAVGVIGNLAIGFVKKIMGSRGAEE